MSFLKLPSMADVICELLCCSLPESNPVPSSIFRNCLPATKFPSFCSIGQKPKRLVTGQAKPRRITRDVCQCPWIQQQSEWESPDLCSPNLRFVEEEENREREREREASFCSNGGRGILSRLIGQKEQRTRNSEALENQEHAEFQRRETEPPFDPSLNSLSLRTNKNTQQGDDALSSSSSSSSSLLSPGVVFKPTEREILQEFLTRKLHNLPFPNNAIMEMDVYDHQPWLYASGRNYGMDHYETYYFVRWEKKSKSKSETVKNPKRHLKSEGNSSREGWWKAITGDKPIRNKRGRIIGFKKTQVLYLQGPKV